MAAVAHQGSLEAHFPKTHFSLRSWSVYVSARAFEITIKLILNALGIHHTTVRTKDAVIVDRNDVVTENAKERVVRGLQVLGLTPSPGRLVNITVDIVNTENMDMGVIELEETVLRTRSRWVSLVYFSQWWWRQRFVAHPIRDQNRRKPSVTSYARFPVQVVCSTGFVR